MKAVLFALNAKYIHSSLAPWCLLAGVEAAGPAGVCAEVREGTVNEPERDVLARILDGEPDAVLFSCYLWNIRETLRLAAAVKAARPGAYVVLGGPEVSYNAGEVLAENPQVDYILSGEGERSVPMLLASLAAGRKPEEEAPPIPGLCARGFLSAPAWRRARRPARMRRRIWRTCAGALRIWRPAGAARMPARSAFLGGVASPAGSRWSRQNGTS